ncbi:MAG: M23 family metallopeptidase [Bacteroidetes bacterium]|nr:M23 family metallopeptidase [Bacteroidota bacterium]MBL6943824.1 M23 family metallopeptidase [Bacteroidales bacterium]
MAKTKTNKKWYKNLRVKYRLVIFNDQTFEDRLSLRLTRLNVFLSVFSVSIIFMTLTFILISNTSIKKYIPGYPDIDEKRQLYNLNILADSLLMDIEKKNLYIANIKNIFEDNIIEENYDESELIDPHYDTIKNIKSDNDSILRAEFENQSMYNLYFTESGQLTESNESSIKSFNFFTPLQGIITSRFNLMENHYGIDIVTSHNEAVKATLEGTVIFSGWTLETGYIIGLQHERNFISVYKHNSVLLKKEGDHVLAGEPIAISGQSGELSTGPHLHFELWENGTPVNPEDYIVFY